jgi:hypothetical protein
MLASDAAHRLTLRSCFVSEAQGFVNYVRAASVHAELLQMALPARIEDYASEQDRRGSPRRTLKLSLPGSSALKSGIPVLVHEISRSGLLIEIHGQLAVGTTLNVDLPECGLRAANVVWIRGRFCGCELTEPLSQAALSAAVLRSVAFRPLEGGAGAIPAPLTLAQNGQGLPYGARMGVIALLAIASWMLVLSIYFALAR